MTDQIITYHGQDYRLIHDAELVNLRCEAVYSATAIKADVEPDEYGTIPSWDLIWYIPAEGEDAINWEEPDNVEPTGGEGNQASYQMDTGRLI